MQRLKLDIHGKALRRMMMGLMLAAVALAVVQDAQAIQAGSTQERLTAAEARVASAEREAARLRRLLADTNVKMSALEKQIRVLTGRIEEMEFDRRQLLADVSGLRDQMATLILQQTSILANQASAPAQPLDGSQALQQQGPTATSAPAPDTVARENAAKINTGEEAIEPLVSLPEGSPAERFDYAFAYISRNELDNGRVAMEAFIAAHPSDPATGNAIFWLGRIHLIQKRPAQAAEQFLQLIDNYPDHAKKPEALLELASVLIDLDSANEACNALADFRSAANEVSPRLVQKAQRLRSRAKCR